MTGQTTGPPYARTDMSVAAQKWRALQYRNEEREKKEREAQGAAAANLGPVSSSGLVTGGDITAMRRTAQEEQQRKQREETDKVMGNIRQKKKAKK